MPPPPRPDPAWHAQETSAVVAALATSEGGLTGVEAARRLAEHGENRLTRSAGDGVLLLAWRQLNNPISWVLVGAGALAIGLGRWTDSLVVFGAVLVNAVIGFIQEHRAGRAIAALSAMVPENATVLRDGAAVSIPAAGLVPGDAVLLQSGDKVPCDLRLLQVKNLQVDESALTGESVPVAKQTGVVPAEATLGDRTGLAFGGTLVTQGTATGLVVATGDATELGRINSLLERTGGLATPLTRQLAGVSAWITVAVLGMSLVLCLYGTLVKGARLGEALMTAVTLAVAAIPEGLPAVITIALAIGVRRMAQRQAVVRHLPAVETLGSTSTICSDKTGTLTRNEMTVQAVWSGGQVHTFTGIGYAPEGRLERDGEAVAEPPAGVRDLVLAASLCNDATLAGGPGGWTIAGDPTEAALVVAGRKLGLDEAELRRRHPRVDVIPFESENRFMATLHHGEGLDAVLLKGAPEVVLARCGLDEAAAGSVRAAQDALARQGLRVLACARRPAAAEERRLDPAAVAGGFSFLGLLGLIDPPRQEAIDAIAVCRRAGITVKMITGDHHATAAAIAAQLGLIAPGGEALSGTQLDALDQAGLQVAAGRCQVFARVSPEHKIRLVQALQAEGQVVAMTGDGVNDAPALKQADIGIAMGITGTAVSKEAAKIVLADDNFATIAAAVEEGRRVYDNLIKSLAFLLPTNLGLALVLAAAVFAFPTVEVAGLGTELLLPMSPTQILWINLVASVALSLPLAFEVLEPGAMRRPPRPASQPLFSRFLLQRTVLVALLMAAGTCGLFLWEYQRLVGDLGLGAIPAALHLRALAEAQTISITTITLFQLFYLLHCRSLLGGLGSLGWGSNRLVWWGIGVLLLLQAAFTWLPPMQRLFGSASLDGHALLPAILVAACILPAISLEKLLRRRLGSR